MTVPAGDILRIEIERIIMSKYNGAGTPLDPVDLSGQLIEFTYYQSIFEPLMRATIVVNDSVNFQYNYPLTGEEIFFSQLNQQYPNAFDSPTPWRDQRYGMIFVVENITNSIVADMGKTSSLVINLVSVESWANEFQHISLVNKASNNTLRLEQFANYIFNTYIYDELKKIFPMSLYDKYKGNQSRRLLTSGGLGGGTVQRIHTEPTQADRKGLIIPNLRPLNAITFCAKHSKAQNKDNNSYLFYENLEGFHFVTLEGKARDNKNAAYSSKRDYYYLPIRGLAQYIPALANNQNYEMKLIANVFYNQRYDTQSKNAGGYFQNRFIEINMAKQTWTKPPETDNTVENYKPILGNYKLSTTSFINSKKRTVASTSESLARVRYNINNFVNDDIPKIRDKWGKSTINATAMNQIDISIAVPPDINIIPGDVLKIHIPLLESFTDNTVPWDPIMSGFYLVSEVKNTILVDGTATTSLRLLRDGSDRFMDQTNLLATDGRVQL